MICENQSPLQQWRKQIGLRRPYRHRRAFAAMGFLTKAKPPAKDLIDIRHLTVVILYDEWIGRPAPALRLVGYGASQVIDGVHWGGPENAKFYKDLRIEPDYGGTDLQLNLSDERLLTLALRLQGHLYRTDRYRPRATIAEPQLPHLWGGFSPSEANEITGSGPELTALCEKFDISTESMLAKFRREKNGLICHPLDWVGEHLQQSLAVFADMNEVPSKQAFSLDAFPASLVGYQGAAAYDFYHSDFREHFESRLKQRATRSRSKHEQAVVAVA